MTQVHRFRIGTPHPYGQTGVPGCGTVHLQSRGIGLPKIFQSHAQSAAYVSGKYITRRTGSRESPYPRTVGMRTFTDRKSVGRRLAQTETVPHRPMVEKTTVLGIELLIGRYAFATHLPPLPTFVPVQCQDAPPVQRLHRFRPYPAIGCSKGHVAVVSRLAHGNLETDTQATDEVTVHVAVEHKGMYHLDLFAPGIKIKAYGERKPFSSRGIVRITAFYPHQCSDIPRTFHRDAFHLSAIVGKMQYRLSFSRRTVLRGAQQSSLSAYRSPFATEAVEQTTAPFGNISLHLACGHPEERACLVHPYFCPGTVFRFMLFSGGLETDALRLSGHHRSHSEPLD